MVVDKSIKSYKRSFQLAIPKFWIPGYLRLAGLPALGENSEDDI